MANRISWGGGWVPSVQSAIQPRNMKSFQYKEESYKNKKWWTSDVVLEKSCINCTRVSTNQVSPKLPSLITWSLSNLFYWRFTGTSALHHFHHLRVFVSLCLISGIIQSGTLLDPALLFRKNSTPQQQTILLRLCYKSGKNRQYQQ